MTPEETLNALWEDVKKVVDTDSLYNKNNDGCIYCPYCRYFQTQYQWLIEKKDFKHEDDCIVLKATALVATEQP